MGVMTTLLVAAATFTPQYPNACNNQIIIVLSTSQNVEVFLVIGQEELFSD